MLSSFLRQTRTNTGGHSVQAISSFSPLDDTNRFAYHFVLPTLSSVSTKTRSFQWTQLALIFYPILIIQRAANIKEVEQAREKAFAKLHIFNL